MRRHFQQMSKEEKGFVHGFVREGIKQTKLSRIEEYSAADEAAKKLAQKNAAWLKKNIIAYA